MNPSAIINTLLDRGAGLEMVDGKIRVTPSTALDEDLRKEVKRQRAAVIEYLVLMYRGKVIPPRIKRRTPEQAVPTAQIQSHTPDPDANDTVDDLTSNGTPLKLYFGTAYNPTLGGNKSELPPEFVDSNGNELLLGDDGLWRRGLFISLTRGTMPAYRKYLPGKIRPPPDTMQARRASVGISIPDNSVSRVSRYPTTVSGGQHDKIKNVVGTLSPLEASELCQKTAKVRGV